MIGVFERDEWWQITCETSSITKAEAILAGPVCVRAW